ncbi:uncharacterized protein LOC120342774 [Styela clava]
MEKNIIDYFKKVLLNKNGHLCMNSFKGHLAELSQKERKYVKKVGLEKLISKYPDLFLLCDEEIYSIQEDEKKEDSDVFKKISDEHNIKGVMNSKGKKSSVNLDSAKDDPCTVCSDPIEIFAIGECRHPICYRCSTKLRVLCEDKNCPVCRQTLDLVVFSKNLLPLNEHKVDDYIKDKKYGIAFENIKVCEQKSALLRHVCNKCPNAIFDNFPGLEAHARDKHQLYYCEICVRQCKIFTEERKTYSKSELKKHIEDGDETGSARGGHPLCRFCDYRYLDNDELLRHLRLHHCSCIICDEVNEEHKNYEFYADKNSLFEHQRENHFPCEHPECMESDRIPVYRDEIDLQGHNLQKHSGQKSKLEKKAEQRISVPFMYERKKDKQKKILKVEPDPAGGIHITGFIARRIEKEYSFIERDDKPSRFEENVFFDLEACGLEPNDDIRKHFKNFDRVSAYAMPVTNPNIKSKWRALEVEKIDDDDVEYEDNLADASVVKQIPEESFNEFPSLASKFPAQSSTSTLSGWASVTQRNPPIKQPAKTVTNAMVFPSPPPSPKSSYDIGYVHKNLRPDFGFIQKDRYNDLFTENVYFNIEAYQIGMNEPLTNDLTKVLSIGEKVCYTLKSGPSFAGVKAKYRALHVWKFSVNNIGGAMSPVSSDQFKVIPNKNVLNRKQKVKNIEEPMYQGITSGQFGALAEISKNSDESLNSREMSLSQDSTTSKENLKVHKLTDIISNIKTIQPITKEQLRVPMPSARKQFDSSSVDVNHNKRINGATVPSDGDHSTPLKPGVNIKDHVFKHFPNINHSSPVTINQLHQSRLGQALTPVSNGTSDDEMILQKSRTTSEVYSSADDDDSEDELNDDDSTDESDDDIDELHPYHNIFMQTLAVCLKNKGIYKILKQQMLMEMLKKGQYITPLDLQFLEFRKEDNSVYILFCNPGGESKAEYIKLNGFYPLESSWASELKAFGLVSKVSKDLYHIKNSSHYITVSRNKHEKTSKVTMHYRSSQPNNKAM